MGKKLTLLLLGIIIVLGLSIRLYKLGNTALFSDELDFGYQALSIAEIGKDYYGNKLPVYFQSLTEWKTSAYIYTLTPLVGLLGINEVSIRLPSVIFGILSVFFFFLLVKELTKNTFLAIVAAFFLSIVPWHVHFSRIGFEASEMFFTYLAGTYFLLKSRQNGKLIILSALFFAVSFVIYRTQLIFIPVTLILMFWLYRKDLLKISKVYLAISAVLFLLITLPYTYQTFFGVGSQRVSSLTIFDENKMNYDLGTLRLEDNKFQNPSPFVNIAGRLFHNKYAYYLDSALDNYLKAYSFDFLFTSGDLNQRQNVQGTGELYKYQFIFVLFGLLFFFDQKYSRKIKFLVAGWLLLTPLAATLTKEGGSHATRLFMMLIPLGIIFSYGVYYIYNLIKSIKYQKIYLAAFVLFSVVSLSGYTHHYFVHYPSESEVWWQAGFKEAIQAAVSKKDNYEKVIISSSGEPAGIFFLVWSPYSPVKFQNNRFSNTYELANFGNVSEIDNFIFPGIGVGKDLYTLENELPLNYLYLATAKEIKLDLIAEPERVPMHLELIQVITYPSGRPAYYLFARK